MKNSIVLAALLIIVLPLKLASQETKTVSSEGNLFTIEVPSTWIPDAAARGLFNFLFLADPDGQGEMLTFSATKSPLGLDRSYKINRDALKDYKKFKLLEEGKTTIGGQDCMWLICTWTSKEGLSMKGKQYTLAHKGRNYCIQYHVIDTEYDRVTAPFDKVIATLIFSE